MKLTQMKCALLLDIIIRQGASVFELLASEDEALLVRRNTLLVLDLRLNIIDRVGRFNLESNRLAGQRFHEDFHATTKTENEMESRLLLDVVIRKSSTVLELFASEDKTPLVRRNTLLILDLRLNIIDRVGRFTLKSNRLAGQRLHKDLHPTAKTKD